MTNKRNRFELYIVFFLFSLGGSFNGSAYIDSDFIRVDIKQDSDKPDITEVHMQAAPKLEVLKRQRKATGIPVNIGLIMFDSTSAANFIRQMPKSNAYLKTRPTVYMKGMTWVKGCLLEHLVHYDLFYLCKIDILTYTM